MAFKGLYIKYDINSQHFFSSDTVGGKHSHLQNKPTNLLNNIFNQAKGHLKITEIHSLNWVHIIYKLTLNMRVIYTLQDFPQV